VRRLLALALLLALPACGDDADTPDAASAGLIIGQQVVDGELADRLLIADPDGPETQAVEIDGVGRGIPAGPDQAFDESDTAIVLVDAVTGEVQDLGLSTTQVDLAYSRTAVDGAGDHFAVLLSPTGAGAALVDLEAAEATDLLETVTDARAVFGAELAPDESQLLLNTDAGVFLVPTEDPDAVEALGDGAGQLTADGSAVLLTGPDGVVLRALDGDDETVVTEDNEGGALAIDERVLLARGDEAVLLDPGSDDVIASAPFSAEGSAPLVVGGTVLLPAGDGPTWTLIDAEAGTATELADLEGFTPAFNGRPPRWVPFAEAEAAGAVGARTLVAVDTADGSVDPVLDLPEDQQILGFAVLADQGPWALLSTDTGDGTTLLLVDLDTGDTIELGSRLQGAAISPDGEQVAWSEGDADSPTLRVAPIGDPESGENLAEDVAIPIWLTAG
jgi:hypothetical protein